MIKECINELYNTISESKEHQHTMSYIGQGAPCRRHFHYELKAFEIIY